MRKILIIDDERKGLIGSLINSLEEKDFEVQVINCAQKALELIEYANYNLIILDIIIPIPESWQSSLRDQCEGGLKTGIVLYREIRNAKPSIPVLIYSSDGDIQILDENTTYLRKPELNSTVIEKINEMIVNGNG